MIAPRNDFAVNDRGLLKRSIELANHARVSGNPPFGALVVDSAGTILYEDWNTTLSDGDMTAHAELKVARWVGREFDLTDAASMTVYASCQPCGMCVGAMERVGVGTAIFAISHADLVSFNMGPPRAGVKLEGPMLIEDGLVPILEYYGLSTPT